MNWERGLNRTKRLGTVLALAGAGCLLLLIAFSTVLNNAQYMAVSRWAWTLRIGIPMCVFGIILLTLSWVVDGFVSRDPRAPEQDSLLK